MAEAMDDLFEIKLMVGGTYYPLTIRRKMRDCIVKLPDVSMISSTDTASVIRS